MIDAPPWVEIAAAAFTTAGVLVWALIARKPDHKILAAWVVTIGFTLVALNAAPMGVLFSVGATVAGGTIAEWRMRIATVAAGVLATVVIMTLDIDWRLIAGALTTTAIASAALWWSERVHGHAITLILIGGTALGIYINVPDTEQIVVLATALPMLAVATLIFPVLRVGTVSPDVLAVVGALVMASGAVGARGEVGSFVGVVGALGVLLAEPIAGLMRRNTRSHPAVMVGVHAAVVLLASRVTGVYGPPAVVMIVVCYIATIALLAVLPRQPTPIRPATLATPHGTKH